MSEQSSLADTLQHCLVTSTLFLCSLEQGGYSFPNTGFGDLYDHWNLPNLWGKSDEHCRQGPEEGHKALP